MCWRWDNVMMMGGTMLVLGVYFIFGYMCQEEFDAIPPYEFLGYTLPPLTLWHAMHFLEMWHASGQSLRPSDEKDAFLTCVGPMPPMALIFGEMIALLGLVSCTCRGILSLSSALIHYFSDESVNQKVKRN